MEKQVLSSGGSVRWMLLVTVILMTLPGKTFLTSARDRSTITITIRNQTQKEIRHVYLAAGNPDNWGPDQLNGSVIAPGGSFALSQVSCDGATIRVIAENQDGCFFYAPVSCADNATWVIPSDATPDCGNW